MSKNGFTLIELMLVTVLISLLATIAIPKYTNMRERARIATLISDLRNLMTAQEAYFENTGSYADDQSQLPIMNTSPYTDLDLWELQGNGFGWRARARLRDQPTVRCGVFIGQSQGQPSVPGIGPVQEGNITCVGS